MTSSTTAPESVLRKNAAQPAASARERSRCVGRSDTDERRGAAFRLEPLPQFDAGHAAKIDVEHEAVELRMFQVRKRRSETHDHSAGELDLRQRALAEAKGIAEVRGVFVVHHRRLVAEMRPNPDRIPTEVLDAGAQPE